MLCDYSKFRWICHSPMPMCFILPMEFVEMYEHFEQPERVFVEREEYLDWMQEALKH